MSKECGAPEVVIRPIRVMLRVVRVTSGFERAEHGHRLGEPSPNVRVGLTLAFQSAPVGQHPAHSASFSIIQLIQRLYSILERGLRPLVPLRGCIVYHHPPTGKGFQR